MDKLSPEDAIARVRAVFGSEITVKPVETPVEDNDSDADVVDLITRVCYYYPQYTLDTAQQLTNAEANALLLQAEKQRAIDYYNLTLISTAPHTKKGKLVDTLLNQYKEIAQL